MSDPVVVIAEDAHIPQLPAIERAAAALFPEADLPLHLRSEATSLEDFRAAREAGRLWVALSATREPVGFALVATVDGLPHLAELSVHPDHGRRGVGTSLLRSVQAWARGNGSRGLTLTTFSHLPWNAPFYARLGFEALEQDRLSPELKAILLEEARVGLDPAKRIAMRCDLGPRKQRAAR